LAATIPCPECGNPDSTPGAASESLHPAP
jgi:hypothetical protein